MILALLASPFVILLLVLIVGAILFDNTICNYCNDDGEPCPMCGSGGKRLR